MTAPVAHGEVGHAGALAIIRKRSDYCKAGAAQSACYERIEVARVSRVEQLCRTFRADCHIRRDRRDGAFAFEAFFDAKGPLAQGRRRPFREAVDPAGKGNRVREFLDETSALIRRPLDFYYHLAGCVNYPSCQAHPHGQTKHGRPAPDALKNPGEDNMFTNFSFHRRHTRARFGVSAIHHLILFRSLLRLD